MGGVSAFGFIGIVLGPLVAVLATAIVESYFARPVEELTAPVDGPQAEPGA
jgi:predicted PurR-regulated permease PerM